MVGNRNTEIPDDIIIASLNLVKSMCDINLEPYIGYFTPAEINFSLNADQNDSATVIKPTLPDNKFSINIHPLPGHWVTSCYYPQTNEVHVYDSLMSPVHYEQVVPQLKLVYGETKTSNIIYSQVTQQQYEPLCGVMAVCFAFSCYLGKDPEFIDYDIFKARQHLRECLIQGEVKSFPEKSFQLNSPLESSLLGTNQTTNDPYTNLQRYFNDQTKRTTEHQMKNQTRIEYEIQSANRVKHLANKPANIVKHCSKSEKTQNRNVKEKQRIQQKRASETSVERAERKEIDRIRKRRKREMSFERNLQNKRSLEARRRKHEASPVKERRNIREREARRRKREAFSVREQRNKRECVAQRIKREASPVREQRNKRERVAQRIKREASPVREQRNIRESIAQRKKREASPVREQRNKRERVAQKKSEKPLL